MPIRSDGGILVFDNQPALAVCYHAISPAWPAELAVPPDVLRLQIEQLVGQGRRPVTLSELVGSDGPEPLLAVTFDDAHRSVVDLAFPILERLGVPGSIFVPTGFIGRGRPRAWPGTEQWLDGPWEGELERADWDALRMLHSAGWEVGSHTETHPRLHELDDDALDRELAGSRSTIEAELSAPCRAVAYPYGLVDDRVEAAAAAAGYTAGAGLGERFPRRPSPLRWPRIGLYRNDRGVRLGTKVIMVGRTPRLWNLVQATREWRAGAGFDPRSRWQPPRDAPR